MCVHLHTHIIYVYVLPPIHLLTSSSLSVRGGQPPRSPPPAGCAPAGGRHCSSPVCLARPGGRSRPLSKGRRGERGVEDARVRRRGRRRRGTGTGPAPVTAGGGRPAPPLATPSRAPSGSPGDGGGTGRGSPGGDEQRRSGERVPGARRGGAGAPRKAAESGGDRRHRRPSVPVAVLCPSVPPPFPLLNSASVFFVCLLFCFGDFFFFLKKPKRLVYPRRAARAASRTPNLLIFPANISELHNGI